MSKIKTMFKSLKVNQTIYDTWYGKGKVIKLTQRSTYIKLYRDSKVLRYPIAHVNAFIRLKKPISQF